MNDYSFNKMFGVLQFFYKLVLQFIIGEIITGVQLTN